MASMIEKMRARRKAIEGGDPTGGDAMRPSAESRRNTESVRQELGSSSDVARETSAGMKKKRTR